MFHTLDHSRQTLARSIGSPGLLFCLLSILMPAWLLPDPSRAAAFTAHEDDIVAYVDNNLVFRDVGGDLITFYYDEDEEAWQDPIKIELPPDKEDDLLEFMLTTKASSGGDGGGAYLVVIAGTGDYSAGGGTGTTSWDGIYLCIWPYQRMDGDWLRKDVGQIGRRDGCLKREDAAKLMGYYSGGGMSRSAGPFGLIYSFAGGEPADPWAVLFPGGILTPKGVDTPASFSHEWFEVWDEKVAADLIDYAVVPDSGTFYMSFTSPPPERNYPPRGMVLEQGRVEAGALAEVDVRPDKTTYRRKCVTESLLSSDEYEFDKLHRPLRTGLTATEQMLVWGNGQGIHAAKHGCPSAEKAWDQYEKPLRIETSEPRRPASRPNKSLRQVFGLSAMGPFVAHSIAVPVAGEYPLEIHKVDLDARKVQTDRILLRSSVVTVLGETDGKINVAIAGCGNAVYKIVDENKCTVPAEGMKLKPECQDDTCVALYSLKKGCKRSYRPGCWDESVIFTPKQAYEVSQ